METTKTTKGHAMFIPFPTTGHINPMLNFSLLLVSKGVKVSIATPFSVLDSVKPPSQEITVVPYSDGSDEGWKEADNYTETFKQVGLKNIIKLVETEKISGNPVNCLVYTSFFPFVLDVAKGLGLSSASFCTQSSSVHAVHCHVYHGLLRTPVENPVELVGLPVLQVQDLPTTVTNKQANPPFLQMCLDQFSNLEDTDWLLLNTFDMLEFEALNWMRTKWADKIITIGPTVPSVCRSNQSKPDSSSTIVEWLNTKEANSVVYVSFGSVFGLGEEQSEEIACGLKMSNKNILWVMRSTDKPKFEEEMPEKLLVVSWCPQVEVLAHSAVGCFITHCGWNSTLEALSLGVPMIGMPLYMDQTTNAKFIQDVWKVGVRAKKDEKGIVGSEEINKCVKDVMEGKRGEEIRGNASRFKELAKEALSEGGSSDKSITKFITSLNSN